MNALDWITTGSLTPAAVPHHRSVGLPVIRFPRLAVLVVRIDWRLVVAAVRESSPPVVALPVAIGLMLLSTLCQSALQTGAMLARETGSQAGIAAVLVGTYTWLAFLAANMLALAAGSVSVSDSVFVDLKQRPVSRVGRFAALQVLSIGGRHLLIMFAVSAPLICLFAAWLPPARMMAALLATVLVLRIVPAMLRVGSRLVRYVGARIVAIAAAALAGAMVASGATMASVIESGVVALLPPSLIAGVAASDHFVMGPWLLIMVSTFLVGAAEYASLELEQSPAELTHSGTRISFVRAIRVYSRACRTLPPLLHGEMTRLARWPRFRLSLVAIGAGMFFLGLVIDPARGLIPWLLFGLVPTFGMSATFSNLFAVDRSGVQAYYLGPFAPRLVTRAKVGAVGAFVILAEIAGWAILWLVLRRTPQLLDLYCLAMAAAYFFWTAGAGQIASVLFPAPTDPNSTGGGIGNLQTMMLSSLATALFAIPVVGAAFLFDSQRIGGSSLAAAAAAVAILTATASSFGSRAAGRLFEIRREKMIAALR